MVIKRGTSTYALKWRLSIRAAKPQPIQAFVNDDRKRGPHRPRRGHVSQFLGEHGTRGLAVVRRKRAQAQLLLRPLGLYSIETVRTTELIILLSS